MKKYLLGFCAIVLAIAFSAFTSPKKDKLVGDKFFVFDGTGSYLSASDMANPANWDYFLGTPSTECSTTLSTEAQGCVIKVSENFYTSDGEDGFILKTGVGAPTIAVTDNTPTTDNRKIVDITNSTGLVSVDNKKENL